MPFSALPHSCASEDVSSIYISQVGSRWNGSTERNATGLIFRVFPRRIRKPLTNCRRFICVNLQCGSCLIHRAWKSFFFHRNNLQPPDFKNQYYHKVGFTPNRACQNPHLVPAGNTIKNVWKKKFFSNEAALRVSILSLHFNLEEKKKKKSKLGSAHIPRTWNSSFPACSATKVNFCG